MVTIGMNDKVVSGKEETFESGFPKVIKAMADIDGHTQTRICRDIDDPLMS